MLSHFSISSLRCSEQITLNFSLKTIYTLVLSCTWVINPEFSFYTSIFHFAYQQFSVQYNFPLRRHNQLLGET